MARTIYDKPVKVLMREFASAMLSPHQTFSRDEVVKWFKEHYPKIKPATVRLHVAAMSVNAYDERKHHQSVKPGSGHDLFYKIAKNQYRLWDESADGPPIYPSGTGERPIVSDNEDDDEVASEGASSQFAFEDDLKNYIARNLNSIEDGLRLYEDEGLTGIEFPAGGRQIDILCVDAKNTFVVVELKVSKGYERVIGQILRYMAWVKTNLADGRRVRGIIVASEISADLKMAASLIPDVSLAEYQISFSLKSV